MLDVITFKWRQPNYRSTFKADHVNILRRMLERHLHLPHRFICITDDPTGIEGDTMPLWPSPVEGITSTKPNCYRRLRLFSSEAKDHFSPRIACIDLDTVITGDLTPIFERSEPFVILKGRNPTTPYNGSLWLLDTGSRTQVWERLVPEAPTLTRGIIGSDQAWLAYVLGPDEATFGLEDGIYSYRFDFKTASQKARLPEGCRFVNFHGKLDPWTAQAKRASPWIEEHYR